MTPAGWTFRVHSLSLTIIIAGLLAGCGGPWRDKYFKKGVDHLTQDEVSERMGPPHTAKTPALGPWISPVLPMRRMMRHR